MPSPKSIPRYDLLVSLDRSAAIALFDFATGSFLAETVLDLAPEAFQNNIRWAAERAGLDQARDAARAAAL